MVGVEFTVTTHAIHFRGRGEENAFFIFHATAHNGQIGFKIQFKHAQGLLHVGSGGGDGHQRQHHIAFLNVVFNPLFVDGDVAFKEMKARVVQ